MKPAYCVKPDSREPRRPADTSAGGRAWGGVATCCSTTVRSGSEHLVEGVDVGLLVAGGPLDRHLQGELRLVVEQAPRPGAVPLVDEQLVCLLVEERAAVGDEVLRDPRRLLQGVNVLHPDVLVLRPFDDALGVDEADRALFRVRRL